MLKMRGILVAAALAMLLMTCMARAQQPDISAMKKLGFLSGTWACTVEGGTSNGLVLKVGYSFSPDGLWMTELSQDAGPGHNDWATQIWGYDVRAGKLVAYAFTPYGVFTKSVEGWLDGAFVSHRDDNGATVSVRPSIVKENCERR
jgi:hypothetical protein